MSLSFAKHKKIYFAFSGILISASAFCLFFFGLEPGIDFVGGSIMEVQYSESRPSIDEVKSALSEIDLGQLTVQTAEDNRHIIRMKDVSEDIHQEALEKLSLVSSFEELRFESVGPLVGKELKNKTSLMAGLAIFGILIYITLAFRGISKKPLPSWEYGLASLIALGHDIVIPLGLFAYLGHFYGAQISIPVVTALLTVLGYSINNTVVVFDRVRENLIKDRRSSFEETVNNSINQSFSRSMNTSLTTLLVLFAVFFFGGETLRYFSLALIVGLTAGTYSSLLLAPLMLVSWMRKKY
jgi:preprotein translocase subunit SecF